MSLISSKDFLEAGKQRLTEDTQREADSREVNEMRSGNEQFKVVVAELTLKNRVLRIPSLSASNLNHIYLLWHIQLIYPFDVTRIQTFLVF